MLEHPASKDIRHILDRNVKLLNPNHVGLALVLHNLPYILICFGGKYISRNKDALELKINQIFEFSFFY